LKCAPLVGRISDVVRSEKFPSFVTRRTRREGSSAV